jgi:hypothetical protein
VEYFRYEQSFACLFGFLLASRVAVPRVPPAINKVAVWPYYINVMD